MAKGPFFNPPLPHHVTAVSRGHTRRGIVLAGGLAATAVTAACTPWGSRDQASSAAQQPVTLSFMWPTHTPQKQEWGEYAMRAYMERRPNTTIEPMWTKKPSETIEVGVASGQPPDVGWFGVGPWPYWRAFKPVAPLLASRGIKPTDFFPQMVDASSWRGQMFALPLGLNTSATFINKAHFQRVGVPLPKDSWTMDDLLDIGRRVTRQDGGAATWATQLPNYTPLLPPAYGGRWIDADGQKMTIDNEPTLRVLTLMRDTWDRHRIAPGPEEYKDYGPDPRLPIIKNGAVAAFFWGPPLLPAFREATYDWELVEVPSVVTGGKPVKGAFLGTEHIFIVNTTPHEAAAADLATWLTGPEHLTWAAKEGHTIPAHQKTARDAFVAPSNEPRLKNIGAFVRAAAYAPPIMPHPAYTELNRVYLAAVRQWLDAGTVTAEQALRQAQTDAQRVLDDWNRANPR